MRKVGWILMILFFCTQCSVSRKRSARSEAVSITEENGNILQSLINQNITNKSFFIEKAEFRIISGGGEKSGIGTIKFILPDRYLVSIKSNAGIEIARIYLTEDSVILNDRLNRKMYYGSASDLKKKYGLTTAILPIIIGDYVNDGKSDVKSQDCVDGKVNIDAVIKDIRIDYSIDCKYGKSVIAEPAKDRNQNGLKIEYTDFFQSYGINIPGKIDISEKQNNTRIEIKIQKIVIPWEGSIEFIPGRQYEKIHLL